MTMFQRFKTCYYYNTLNNGSSCPFLCPSIHRKLLTKNVTAAAHKQKGAVVTVAPTKQPGRHISHFMYYTTYYSKIPTATGIRWKTGISLLLFFLCLATCNILLEQKNK